MMDTLQIITNIAISTLTGITSGFCIFKFLGRKWVENWFAKDLKQYEHKLAVLKIKDEIKFNILHKERIDTIRQLHTQIIDLTDSMLYLLMPSEMQKTIQINVDDLVMKNKLKSHKIQMYLLANDIYLPKILVKRITGVCYTFDSISKSIMMDKTEENKKRLNELYLEKVRPLLDELKNEFRRLLGVEFNDGY